MLVSRSSLATVKFALALGVGLLALSGGSDARASGKESAFDREAAMSALTSVDVAKCKAKKGPTGDGHVIVTFAPTGSASEAVVDQAPFAGTKVGKCIAKAFKKVKVPAFDGAPINVGKKFHVE